jgi:hypothetical protein
VNQLAAANASVRVFKTEADALKAVKVLSPGFRIVPRKNGGYVIEVYDGNDFMGCL